MRTWEENPPVELPPEFSADTLALSGAETYQSLCAQCHGTNAEGGVGPSLRSTDFREDNSRETIFNSVNLGHEGTAMITWGEVLSAQQIDEIVDFILSLPVSEGGGGDGVSFAATVKPAFDTYCQACHNESFAQGGWLSTSYDDVINSGDNAPSVIPGDVENSLLAQKILGIQEIGNMMPPAKLMPEDIIQNILDWIEQGAQDN
jgi:mono/diheme cytochrome c family protein